LSAAASAALSIPLRPSPRELAFVRACVEGVDTAQAFALYLADDRQTAQSKPRLVLDRVIDKLRSLARAHGRPEVAALLGRDPAAVRGPSSDLLALEAYRDQQALDFYTEAELAELYSAEFSGSARRDPARRRERLRLRLVEALQWLGSLPVREPMPQDPVASWLDDRVSARLEATGIRVLGDLSQLIGRRGFRWHRAVRGMGPSGAARLVRWLQEHEATLGALPAPALQPDRQIDKAAAAPAPRTGIVPLERFIATPETDGSSGSNRAPVDQCLIDAKDDAQAVRVWLARWPSGSATWRAYRKEAERLLLWAVVERGKALSSLDQSDCLAYRRFIAQPGLRWTAPRRTQRWNDSWRPFEGPLAERSAAVAVSILGAMFRWLVQQGHLSANPWPAAERAGARAGRGAAAPPPQRVLAPGQLQQWNRWLDGQTPGPAVERLRFIVDFTAMTGLRRSELAAARWSDLRSRGDGAGAANHFLQVAARRHGGREVPLSQGAVGALHAWSRSRGLSLEAVAEAGDAPLVTALATGRALSAVRLHEIVSSAMKRCSADLASQDPDSARRFSAASLHWLRHSCGVETAATGASVSDLMGWLGHARAETVMPYFTAPQPEGDTRRKAAEMI
jgi:integrase